MIRLVPLVQHPSGHQHDSEALATMRHLGPGLAFTGALAVGLSFLETLEGLLTTYLVLGALVLPFLLGVRIRNACVLPAGVSAGATFASKTLLEVAVVVLGTWIDIRHIVEPGGLLLVAIPTGVGGGMAPSFGLSKLLGLNSRLGYLVAVRNAICGNSAIAAVAPVRGLPHHGNAAAPVIRRGLFCLPRVAHPGAPPRQHLANTPRYRPQPHLVGDARRS